MRVFDSHAHTHYSNLRLLDCINQPKDLISKAIEIGLQGIAITDHECLSGSIEINKLAQEVNKEYPDFKIALGNEIYLTDTRDKGQKYYHFILLAKDKIGHKALRELSSQAWFNSYIDRRMERVPTLKSEFQEIVQKYKGHLIATSACIGGELGSTILNLEEAERLGLQENVVKYKTQIHNFITFCTDLFQDDFYIECAPGCSKDQIVVNKRAAAIAAAYNIKMCIGSDAHYLSKDERYIHKSYLNSKEGDREVDLFYEYTYLMSPEELKENLLKSYDEDLINQIFQWSMTIYDKIENYSLLHNQTVVEVPVKDYPKKNPNGCYWSENNNRYPILKSLFESNNLQERYWINQCAETLEKKDLLNDTRYWDRLEEEAKTKRIIGEKLGTNIFAYPNTLQHYIDMIWGCGSIVGAGRGSSCSGLNHMLLGITQLDPIKWDLPWFRYLNEERIELPDIDLDMCPSKRPAIIRAIKDERKQFFNDDVSEFARNNLGCTLIATFGTETTKSAIATACRGYRSEDFPNGIDVDDAQYLSSLVPSERGFLWPIHDVVYGNEDKGRKPSTQFINAIKQYPGLLEIIVRIESLINKRSSHASGVIFFDKDPYEYSCFMKTPKGEIITQYDLHMAEAAGSTKYDFLVTEISDKIVQTIELLQADNLIDPNLTLREAYDKYLHPEVLPHEDKRIWKAIQYNEVLNLFQFDSLEGSKAASRIKPKNILELSDANGLMRLMTAEKGEETPMDKYVRYKDNIQLWYKEMRDAGLTIEEQKALEPYFLSSYGVPPSQEQLMTMLMDPKLCHFTLAEANAARKIVGKKQMSKIPELHQKILDQAASANLGAYIWRCGVGP